MDVDGFRDYCQSQVERQGGGMSQSTADTYIPIVERFADWLPHTGEPSAQDIRDWIRHQEIDRQVSNSTIQSYYNAVRKYFYYQQRMDDLGQVTAWVSDQYPKGGSDTPPSFTDDEVDALRDAASEDPRANAIVAILSTMGCRVSELVELERGDITWIEDHPDREGFRENDQDWVEGTLSIHRHKRMEDVTDEMPFGDYERDTLEEYLDHRSEYATATGTRSAWLFPSVVDGEARHITTQTVRNILDRVAERATGVDPDGVYPHKFRHTVATNFGKDQYTSEQIANYLGQKNPSSAQVYTHLDRSDVAKMRGGSES